MKNETYQYLYNEADKAGLAALVGFHGTGGNKEEFGKFLRTLAPERDRLTVDGTVFEGNARRFFRRYAEGQYDLEDLEIRTDQMAVFLDTVLEKEALPVFEDGLIGIGYSNGANILANLLMKGHTLFDQVILMHPLIPFALEGLPDLSGRAVTITAGKRDQICPPNLTEHLASGLSGAGAQVSLKWFEGGHEIADSEVAYLAAHLKS